MTSSLPEPVRVARRLELTPLPPYDFAIALAYLHSSPSSVLEIVDLEAGRYRRALSLGGSGGGDGRDVLLTIRSCGTVDEPRLSLDVQGIEGDVAPEAEAEAVAFVRRVFRLDDDPAPFMATALQDPVLHMLAERFRGVRPLLVADPYEALLFAIIGQQVNVAFARKMKLALIEAFGRRRVFDGHGQEHLLLPEPEVLAAVDPAELTAMQFSRQKASYIVGLSQAIVAGDLNLWALPALSFEEALSELTRHRGIGRWTAEYILMRGLGAPDSIPAADVGLRKIIGYAYGLGRNASEDEVRTLAERWAGWRGWAAFLWWLALQMGNQSPAAGLDGVL